MALMRSIRRFVDDEQGTITIEFVAWLPFLMLWFTGTVIFYDAFQVRDAAAKAVKILREFVMMKGNLVWISEGASFCAPYRNPSSEESVNERLNGGVPDAGG